MVKRLENLISLTSRVNGIFQSTTSLSEFPVTILFPFGDQATELTAPRLSLGGGYNFTVCKSVKLLAEANLDLTLNCQF